MKHREPKPAPCVNCAKSGTEKCVGMSCRPFTDWLRHRRRVPYTEQKSERSGNNGKRV